MPPPALSPDDARCERHDVRYAKLQPGQVPLTECLKDTVARFLPYWHETIAPAVKSGKQVIIAAHGNSLRALVKHLSSISDADITGLEIPTGQPIVYQLDDALNATRAAVQEGVIVGGGVALVQAGKVLAGLEGANSDQNAGIAIVRRALEAPLRQIAENAGVDGAVVAGKVRESNDPTFGFNAQTEEYGDMFAFGVIDPAKVTRTALEDVASIASLLITTEAMIADRPEPKGNGGGQGGGMGGMGGMDGMM